MKALKKPKLQRNACTVITKDLRRIKDKHQCWTSVRGGEIEVVNR